jgi:hypothetical protein
MFEQAVVIAENEIVLRCVRLKKVAIIERLGDSSSPVLGRLLQSLLRTLVQLPPPIKAPDNAAHS